MDVARVSGFLHTDRHAAWTAPIGGAAPDWLKATALGLIGVTLGLVSATSLALAVGVVVVMVLIYAFGRTEVKAEVLVGAYWIAFCAYETIFAEVTVSGFFYAFYMAFVAFTFLSLARGSVRIRVSPTAAYVVFLVVVLVSFIGFANAIDFRVVQRVIAYCFGLLVMVQFSSERGLRVVWGAAILSGLIVATWVIDASVRGDFGYRGGVDVNQNDATLYIALGLVPAFAALVSQFLGDRPRARRVLPLAVLVGAMAYAVVLLASRGMSVGIVLAFAAIVTLAVVRNRRVLAPALLILAAFGGLALLPGGTALIERFGSEAVESGNNRYPLWAETWESFTGGEVTTFLLGNGYDSNKDVLRREFGWTTSTHNAYLQILYEFGLIGLVLFLGLHAALLARAWLLPGPWGLVVVGLTVFLLGANLTTDTSNSFMYWTALGFELAVATWAGRVPATLEPVAPGRRRTP